MMEIVNVIIVYALLTILLINDVLHILSLILPIPNPIEKLYQKREKERLENLGLLPYYHAQTAQYLYDEKNKPITFCKENLDQLIKKYTVYLDKKPKAIGRGTPDILAHYFINFNAPNASDLDDMAQIMVNFIHDEQAEIKSKQSTFIFHENRNTTQRESCIGYRSYYKESF